ncbi:hypothetical protein Fmac_022002 [Flemingia macrophylla]|uniref:Uncharacterized protein n=1 Tax=Flemingia macrophylla TaxID=520843 RepID=A0ABD1LYH0_9FABA
MNMNIIWTCLSSMVKALALAGFGGPRTSYKMDPPIRYSITVGEILQSIYYFLPLE